MLLDISVIGVQFAGWYVSLLDIIKFMLLKNSEFDQSAAQQKNISVRCTVLKCLHLQLRRPCITEHRLTDYHFNNIIFFIYYSIWC